jgi:hypothetical protein
MKVAFVLLAVKENIWGCFPLTSQFPYRGEYLGIGVPPARFAIEEEGGPFDTFPMHVGQTGLLRVGFDPRDTASELFTRDLQGGFLVSVPGFRVLEHSATFQMTDFSVYPFAFSPASQKRFDSDPNSIYSQAAFRARQQSLECGVWYPIEIALDNNIACYAVMSFSEFTPPTGGRATIRLVLPVEVSDPQGSRVFSRFGKPLGTIEFLFSSRKPGLESGAEKGAEKSAMSELDDP